MLDRVWDETQPPDSQAANLLGQDIRQLKTDVRERIFFMGNDADKPALEAVFTNVPYFALDTGKIYRFVANAWTEVSASVAPKVISILPQQAAIGGGVGTIKNIIPATIQIPVLSVGQGLRLTLGGYFDAPWNPVTMYFQINGANIAYPPFAVPAAANMMARFVLTCNGVQSQHIVSSEIYVDGATPVVRIYAGADFDSSLATNQLNLQMLWGGNFILRPFLLELIN